MNGENQQPVQGQPTPPEGQWQYHADTPTAPYQPVNAAGAARQQQEAALSSELEWSASEFIAHSKGLGWYVSFVVVSVIITILAYIVTRDVIPTMLVAAITVIFGVAAGRSPRVLTYQVTPAGLYIGSQFYPYSEYKSFSIVDEGAFSSIMFWPLKRFGFPIGVYYEPANEEKIVETLANHLPMQEHQTTVVEQLMQKIRF